ncbi:MAG: TRAP transporter large permease subunit [Rhodospirillaceae bacterium]|nr:TRAP transporter large permease subunit [Rhodospirillaceae bacterium]
MAENLDILMFAALAAAILLGYPVVFTLAGLAVGFALLGAATGQMGLDGLRFLSQRVFAILTNQVLLAIPLFVTMGMLLERSRIAEELLEDMGRLFGGLRGGLGVSVTLVGMLLAASTGIVGATVVTMALIALPTMMRAGYGKPLASGVVISAGTLGQIIPPSTMLIILADVMSSGYQQAQYEMGRFSVDTISVGQVFAAALVPGLMLVGLYIAFVLVLAALKPEAAPAMRDSADPIDLKRTLMMLTPPLLLIVAVLGSILGGVATPTEAASVGAVGALMLAAARQGPLRRAWPIGLGGLAVIGLLVLSASFDLRVARQEIAPDDQMAILAAGVLTLVLVAAIGVALVRVARAGILTAVVDGTLTVTCMIFAMLIGASLFSLVFHELGGADRVEAFLGTLPGGEAAALFFVMAVIFVMGFFLDFVEISIIVLPLVIPTLLIMGIDPVWLAVMIAINLQTSFMTPPFGFSLFYLRGAAPREVRTLDIYKGAIPFVLLNVCGIGLVYLFPIIGTWLPGVLFP